ncbi:endophilin-B1-like isoform X2 [Mercenaria mercenaria]|uniref:endophilin-B1-like isoform X2 n=1 Tax=Mercenaria mercenaria TaxID=6596 RepID=UPI00234E39B1|nr:endophilin-B1-like isoform X2 [Mercenaria mercenaria]
MDANNFGGKLKRFAGTAGTVFNRAVQFTEEKLGSAEKTELDAHFENLLNRSEKTRIWTDRTLKQTEALLQPNPNIRMEEMFYEKLDKRKRDRNNVYESLGGVMVDAGNEFGPGTAYGNALVKCGQTQILMGSAYREFIQSSANNFLQPLQNFLEGDMKTIMKEKKILETKRLDLDSCKSRLRKAKQVASQTQDDVIAKAEADLRQAQSEFDRQAEITKLLLEGITSTHAHHLRCLNDFIEAQRTFHAQSQQYMADLQKQLGSGEESSPTFVEAFSELLQTKETSDFTAVPGSGAGSTPNNLGLSSGNNSTLTPSAPPAIQVTASTPATEKKQARVLYDYDAADPSELSLLADELITVYRLPNMEPDWLMAERGSQKGKVPTTYLEVLE